ncbi:MAG: hypothetical protein CMJ84_10010 [Planctomycetes bacterium]|nr:hypothetical protein [Planctomycetota bacterium]
MDSYRCGVFIGPTGTGKTHLLTALGYAACEKGIGDPPASIARSRCDSSSPRWCSVY